MTLYQMLVILLNAIVSYFFRARLSSAWKGSSGNKWAEGYAICRVCSNKTIPVLEVDPDPEIYEYVCSHMECSNCGNFTVNFVDKEEYDSFD